MSKKRKTACVIMSVVTLCVIFFIFMNSLKNSDESSRDSDFVTRIVGQILAFFHIHYPSTGDMSHAVRKLAHFTEFFLLGTSVYFTLYAYNIKSFTRSLISPAAVLLVAVCDELIQLGSQGRSAQFTDVLIDFFGGLLAVLVFSLIYYFVIRRRNKDNYYV